MVINVTVLAPSASGSLTVRPPDANPSFNNPNVSFVAGQTEQSQLMLGMGGQPDLTAVNNGPAAVQVIVDVVGFYTGSTTGGDQAFFASGYYDPVFDSRNSYFKPVPPGGTADVSIWYPIGAMEAPNGIGDASILVSVLTPATDGSASIWPANPGWDGSATVSFVAGHTQQRMLMMRVGQYEAGDVYIRNDTGKPITLVVELNGWTAN